jgi:hypothetical protein
MHINLRKTPNVINPHGGNPMPYQKSQLLRVVTSTQHDNNCEETEQFFKINITCSSFKLVVELLS